MVETVEQAEQMIEDQEVVVIGFFDKQDSEDCEAFKKVAEESDAAFFLITSANAVKEKYGAKKEGDIILFKKFDEGKVQYDGEMKVEVSPG